MAPLCFLLLSEPSIFILLLKKKKTWNPTALSEKTPHWQLTNEEAYAYHMYLLFSSDEISCDSFVFVRITWDLLFFIIDKNHGHLPVFSRFISPRPPCILWDKERSFSSLLKQSLPISFLLMLAWFFLAWTLMRKESPAGLVHIRLSQ